MITCRPVRGIRAGSRDQPMIGKLDLSGGSSLQRFVRFITAAAVLGSAATASGQCPPQLTFGTAINYLTLDAPQDVAVGDLDGDGDMDMVTANFTNDNVSVFMNTGPIIFAPSVSYNAHDGPRSVALGDLDGDGDLDIAVANELSDNVSVLLNNGSGTFAPRVNYNAGNGPLTVAIGDLDGDGDLDLTTANVNSNNVSVLLNSGGGTFTPRVDHPVGNGPASVALGDLDSDGDVDVVAANYNVNTISVLFNTGAATFSAPIDFFTISNPRGVALGDLDGDGDLDVVTANDTCNGSITVMRNDGIGIFGSRVDYTGMPCSPQSVALTDLDEDGDLDAVTASSNGSSNMVSVFRNTGTGAFGPRVDLNAASSPVSVKTGDRDGDGDLDLFVVNAGSDSVSVLRNTGVFNVLIVNGPASFDACPGGPATFRVGAIGTGPLQYRWRRNGVDIAGATSPVYFITQVTEEELGTYDVVVSNACSSVTSAPAVLTLDGVGCCSSDVNGDGVVNSTDVSDYINQWFDDIADGCGG